MDLFSLEGKVAIVTGSSRGLGQAIAVGLARAGANVVGVARSSQKETKKLVEETGGEFFPMAFDLRNFDSLHEIVKLAKQRFGSVDILINNAGTTLRKPALEFTPKDWDQVLDVNLKSVFFLSQAFARELVANNKGGKIVNIASMQSFQGGILITPYTASKHGVLGLTKVLANEWAKYGINVNAIAPGYMETEMTAPLREDPVRNREILSRIPAGRWGKPEDLIGAVVFLASEASDYINGSVVVVDGGWLSR
ncbi:MAG: 2-deoxy-D-gluconate 3-dehydrogenase [Thermotogae bacterium]|nr:MAG: 2-deoxy-D-gluconate 3-dehydrogenase [Thermotogota bacterium]